MTVVLRRRSDIDLDAFRRVAWERESVELAPPALERIAECRRSFLALLDSDPELVVYSDWRIPRGTEAARELLSLPDPPTAIFGFNDNVAIGALHAARERGLSVPEDLSVVGFDDTEQSIIVTPRRYGVVANQEDHVSFVATGRNHEEAGGCRGGDTGIRRLDSRARPG